MKTLKYCIIALYSSSICIPFTAFLQNDLLDDAFQPSKNLDHVINIGNNKNAVWNEVFRGSTNIDGVSLDGIQTSQKAPLLVRITQTLLRLTIALSIPVLIRIGLKLIKNGMSGWDIKEWLKEVSGVLLWLMLALSAVGIIYLIQSIATQSLNI